MVLPKAFNPFAVISELKRTIASIHAQWRGTRRENERLQNENQQWRERAQQLERERERLREENERLKRQLEEAQRTAKRLPLPAAFGNETQSAPAASPVRPMGNGTANLFRVMSMK